MKASSPHIAVSSSHWNSFMNCGVHFAIQNVSGSIKKLDQDRERFPKNPTKLGYQEVNLSYKEKTAGLQMSALFS